MVWTALADGQIDYLNHRWCQYTGLSLQEASGCGWQRAIHPDDLKELVDYWQSCLAAGEPGDTEARMRRFDGVYRWFLFRANPLRDESGTIIKWYGTNVDIEDRKQAEEALRASRAPPELTINAIPTMAWSTRPDGYCDFLNQRWLELYGFHGGAGAGLGLE